jgi:hypothetical protein
MNQLIFYKKDLISLGYAENEHQFKRKLSTGRLPQGTKMGTAKNAHREWTRQQLVDWETAEGLYILRPRPPAGAEPVPVMVTGGGTIWDEDSELSPNPKDLKMMVSYTSTVDRDALMPVLDAALTRMKKDWH